jgi:hypothetical protein
VHDRPSAAVAAGPLHGMRLAALSPGCLFGK